MHLNRWVNHVRAIAHGYEKFLQDHGLHLEATHMFVVDHHGKSFTENLHEHHFVELCRKLGLLF